MDYKLTDFDYHLPPELIAQTPLEPRDSSRLLCLSRQDGQIHDKTFHDIADLLGKNDVLVVNQTRVINARLKGCIIPNAGTLLSSFEEGGVRRTEPACPAARQAERKNALAVRSILPRSCGSVPPKGHILMVLVARIPPITKMALC